MDIFFVSSQSLRVRKLFSAKLQEKIFLCFIFFSILKDELQIQIKLETRLKNQYEF